MVEDRGPLLESAVRGNNNRPLFIAQRNDLEEQVGACLVNREIAELVEDEQRRFRVFFQLGFETSGTFGRGEGIDHLNGTGKEDRGALEARGRAQGCRQGGVALLMTMPSWG